MSQSKMLDLSQITSHPIAKYNRSQEKSADEAPQLIDRELPPKIKVGPQMESPSIKSANNNHNQPFTPNLRKLQSAFIDSKDNNNNDAMPIRRTTSANLSYKESFRARRSLEPLGSGLYNNDLPSPKPNVLLPNFSISPYSESKRSNK